MSPTVRNILWYVAIATGGAVLATGLQLGVVLSGTGDIALRPLVATFVTTLFGALATAAGTAFRPKAGREDISDLVTEVGHSTARGALEVEAVKQATGVASFSPEQVSAMVAAVKAELMATPAEPDALIPQPPGFLDRAERPAREGR